jgi:hypothetical protein
MIITKTPNQRKKYFKMSWPLQRPCGWDNGLATRPQVALLAIIGMFTVLPPPTRRFGAGSLWSAPGDCLLDLPKVAPVSALAQPAWSCWSALAGKAGIEAAPDVRGRSQPTIYSKHPLNC